MSCKELRRAGVLARVKSGELKLGLWGRREISALVDWRLLGDTLGVSYSFGEKSRFAEHPSIPQ